MQLETVSIARRTSPPVLLSATLSGNHFATLCVRGGAAGHSMPARTAIRCTVALLVATSINAYHDSLEIPHEVCAFLLVNPT